MLANANQERSKEVEIQLKPTYSKMLAVYNPVDMISVFGAAIAKAYLGIAVCPVGKQMGFGYQCVFWMDVEPIHPDENQRNIFVSTKPIPRKYYDSVVTPMNTYNPEEGLVDDVINVVWLKEARAMKNHLSADWASVNGLKEARNIAMLAKQYIAGENISLVEQAAVWRSYENCIAYLNGLPKEQLMGSMFSNAAYSQLTELNSIARSSGKVEEEAEESKFGEVLSQMKNPRVRQYLAELKRIKALMERNITLVTIPTMKKQDTVVPIFNVSMVDMPFVTRLAAHRYRNVVCYEQCGGNEYYHIYCKDRSVEEYIQKFLQKPNVKMVNQY